MKLPQSEYLGPSFQLVDETPAENLVRGGGAVFDRPIVARGAVRAWPAWERWSFERLADRCEAENVTNRFQEGLVEQGATRPLPVLPVAPYLRELADASRNRVSAEAGLLPDSRRRALADGERFHLSWSHMQSFEANRRYLADWPVLSVFPDMRQDFGFQSLWPGRRWTWEYVFIGPANTVTGLHQDIHDNWFCQIRGTKELLLIPRDQTPYMCVSSKHNLGSVLSRIDVAALPRQPREAAEFAKTRGAYARVEAGDALFIPKHTWHTVVSLEPSISLGVFGLTAREVVTAGAWSELKNLFHTWKLYKWGNCICHESPASPS